MENIRMPLRELIDTAKERLQELQYAPATINAFSRYWRELLEYAEKVQTQYFSVTLGEDYLREVCHIDVAEGTHDPDLPRWKVNPPKRAVYLLVDLQNSGSVLRKVKEKYTPVPEPLQRGTDDTIQEIYSGAVFAASGTEGSAEDWRNAGYRYHQLFEYDDGVVSKNCFFFNWKSSTIFRIPLPGGIY